MELNVGGAAGWPYCAVGLAATLEYDFIYWQCHGAPVVCAVNGPACTECVYSYARTDETLILLAEIWS
jgi:hypothetical protein